MTSLTGATSQDLPTAELVASLLRDGLDVQLRLSGWSMKPLFRPGCLVRFSARATPRVGDIALVRYPNDQLVAHRVVALDATRVQTKGDSCLSPEGPVPHSSVIACAISLRGTLALPLRNVFMRRVGLLVTRLYPTMVRGLRRVLPRKDGTFVEAN
jgi:hypothetical protein